MEIDDTSEAVGSLRADVRNIFKILKEEKETSSQSRQGMREDLAEIKHTLAAGSGRIAAIEGRLDEIEPLIKTHIAECRSVKDQRLGAELYRKAVWATVGAGGTMLGTVIVRNVMALIGAH